jgi:hypothetical protein
MKGYKNIFFGFILVMLDINIGGFDILPDFIGFLLVYNGLNGLYIKTSIKAFLIGKHLSSVSLIMEFFYILVFLDLIKFNNISVYIIMNFMAFIQLLLVLYIYQGMSGHMKVLEKEKLSHKFESENKKFAVIQGLVLLLMTLSLNMPSDKMTLYTIVLVAASLIMHIRLLMNLSQAKGIVPLKESL